MDDDDSVLLEQRPHAELGEGNDQDVEGQPEREDQPYGVPQYDVVGPA
ncbi:hypothetical protein [Intrasporangium oryzae]|nr:hypothetical protein [Intrasporangium oryzae]